MVKAPSSFVVMERETFVSTLRMVIVTPGADAPAGSRTIPVTVAGSLCPKATASDRTVQKSVRTILRRIIRHPGWLPGTIASTWMRPLWRAWRYIVGCVAQAGEKTRFCDVGGSG